MKKKESPKQRMYAISAKLPLWMQAAIEKKVAKENEIGQPSNASRVIRTLLAQALKAEGVHPNS